MANVQADHPSFVLGGFWKQIMSIQQRNVFNEQVDGKM